MQDRSPVMKRCQAVAAHGRRCMQTPYVTSPFCWHHTARADRDGLRREGLRNVDPTKVSADRIISVLGGGQSGRDREHHRGRGPRRHPH